MARVAVRWHAATEAGAFTQAEGACVEGRLQCPHHHHHPRALRSLRCAALVGCNWLQEQLQVRRHQFRQA